MFITKACINLYKNLKYQRILNQVYEQDQIILKLSQVLGVQFKRDWVGRLYAVLNPAIRDGQYDYGQVFEYNQGGYDTSEHMQQWIMSRLSLVQNFIQTNNLFDILSYNITRLDDNGNYLFVIYPYTLPHTMKMVKYAFFEVAAICCAIGTYIIL